MGKFFVVLLLALCAFTSSAFAGGGPTKQALQPSQGMDVADERCIKYAGDEVMEGACVFFHSGAFLKNVNGKKYQLNVPLLSPINVDTNRPAGKLIKCREEMIFLRNGDIGWTNDHNCDYQ